MDMPVYQIKKEMCDIGYRIWLKGFCAGNEGNHSVRISEDRVLCTPTGLSKGFLTPEDMCLVDMDGKQVEANLKGRKRTSEVLVHLAIYKKRPDVKAVIHSHPPHATTFAIAQIPLPEGLHPEAEVFLGKVRTAPYALPSTQALPDSITPLIGPETNTVLMGNHGSVSFSNTLIDTYYKLEILDAYCRILLLCKNLGKANVFTSDEMVDLLKVKQKFGFKDSRLACAPEGCIGEDNQPFFATYDHTASASCDCHGGEVEHATQAERQEEVLNAPSATSRGASSGGNDPAFESLVQTITSQIMASMGRN